MDPVLTSMIENWNRCGIHPGDTVLVHSSVRRTLAAYAASPERVLDAFLSAVGDQGTVLFPLFNFEFTKGFAFDIRRTPSRMGALTEAARKHPGTVRSGHPIYSFAAIGAHARRFAVDNFSGYGADSPFGILRELDGKIAVLDLPDLHSMTFYHHVEEMLSVDYRYHKTFTGSYTDAAGSTRARTYGLFVRDIARGVQTDVDPMGERLWGEGLYHGDRPQTRSGLRTISANAMFESVAGVIRAGKALGLLYSIETAPAS